MKRRLAYSSVSHMGFVLLGIASFTDIGMSGALLQMVSHGLIASVLFFLTGVTYDRTHTMTMDDMGGIGTVMPKVFTLYTAGAVASLALPGMSGFVSELSVFIGITTSPIYSVTFRTVTVVLAAVGLILTPIYLLSMLRQVFYGSFHGSGTAPVCDLSDRELRDDYLENQSAVCFGTDCLLPGESVFSDARRREILIAASFLVLIIGIGCYPKLATQMFDAKTVAVNAQMMQSYRQVAQGHPPTYAMGWAFPKLAGAQVAAAQQAPSL
jgi:NAD(P)H-quinone oxidoreductase subunit 4